MFPLWLPALLAIVPCVRGWVHPVTAAGTHFYDSETHAPFVIRGLDYQPGGSSGFDGTRDPLSDPTLCARDIVLFQELGINTVRIYSVNPALNHDKCMTMLALAGIYVLLDVNTPLPHQHLNRYEPWTTYTPAYLEHVFAVVQQFSNYNNTLGFFAGNEVVNDGRSAQFAPVYVKKLITDIKRYIAKNSKRPIPVGYSAADDLRYRVSLARYLECEADSDSSMDGVDFYGVNSYQWCGEQTLESAGYDELIAAYANYTRPVFLSEYGCNKVLPRQFQETGALYSSEMLQSFSGGLVYEFSHESNHYGLVNINADESVRLRPDFTQLKQRYSDSIESMDTGAIPEMRSQQANAQPPRCAPSYSGLGTSLDYPKNLAKTYIDRGVKATGGYCELSSHDLKNLYKIEDENGNPWTGPAEISLVATIPSDIVGSHIKERVSKNEATTLSVPLALWLLWHLLRSIA